MDWLMAQVRHGQDGLDDPRATPLRLSDLEHQPPTLIVTAGFDPLRDEGWAFAEALYRAGVPVEYRCRWDMFHGFVTLSRAFPQADDVGRRVAGFAADCTTTPTAATVRGATEPAADPPASDRIATLVHAS